MEELIEGLAPDIVISNTTLVLAKYVPSNPRTMKVQIFHSVPYKNYIIVPETLAYDLVLLPGKYHKNTLVERFKVEERNKLKAVGWPRTDNFFNHRLSPKEKNDLMKKFDLDPALKTVLYAPTWDAFHEKGLFPRSFGPVAEAFDRFCRELKKFNVNLVMKLHPYAHKLIEHSGLHEIADKYKVCLAYKKPTRCLDRAVKDFLFITDVLISDVSGIITDFMVLNRPIVYIEPDVDPEGNKINWCETDLPKEYRAGEIVNSMDGLIQGVKRSLKNPDEYKPQRQDTLQKLFFKLDGHSSERAASEILSSYNEFIKEGRVS
ncbi:MAG: CDP-glycerol glycerophosphotransferase family protein [Pseudomonadota bacterium]